MANKNIKGITIEIGGETTKLEKALKNVNSVVYSTNNEIKQLNQALKLDPKNTELLSQKQEALKKNIQATTEKLNTLKEAQRQMGAYNSLTEEQKENYRALLLEITKSQTALKKMNSELKTSTSVDLSKLKDGLKKVGDVAAEVTKKMMQVTAAVSGALAGLVTAGVKSYADLEQNLGGVETLFGDSANKVVENAKKAFETAGVSANEYMAGVTSFSASLLQSLSGDTDKAADVADMAFRDMSDNANKFGTDMQSIQNAYQGFAKQNYTMLDNLKLGYGGTKEEMARLLADAQEISGVKYDIKNLSDVYNAIHVIQDKLYVTGTTADEAEKTISGSVSSMKAAFDNFLNGSGSPEQLSKTITNVFRNVSNAIKKIAPDILKGVVSLIQELIPQIVSLIVETTPQLLDAVTNMIDSLLEMLSNDTEGISNTITVLIDKIVQFITENFPKIIQIGLQLIISLVKGIADSIPTIIPAIVQCIQTIINVILENLPLILESGIKILVELIKGIVDAIPQLIEMLPTIIETIVKILIENLPLIWDASVQIIFALIDGLIKSLPQLAIMIPKIILTIVKGMIEGLPKFIENGGQVISSIISGIGSMLGTLKQTAGQIVSTITDKIKGLPGEALNWGKDMVEGIANGIKSAIGKVGDAAKSVANKIKNFLHFSRPDEGPLREYETWMPDFAEGLARTLNNSRDIMAKASKNLSGEIRDNLSIDGIVNDTKAAMRSLNSNIAVSLNPTINPSAANEMEYSRLVNAFKEALKDTKVVMNGREMGSFVSDVVERVVYP